MKACAHTKWLGISTQENEILLLQSDRPQTLLDNNPYLDEQYPSLFVLIGNVGKYLALKELVSTKTIKRSNGRRNHGEIHLHLDSSSIFQDRPIFIADGDLPKTHVTKTAIAEETCHETIRRAFPRIRREALTVNEIADDLYSRLLHPFADVFCLFSADIGGLRPIAHHIASWLERPQASTLPSSTFPRLVIVTESISREREREARAWFLRTLSGDTHISLFDRFSDLDVISLFPETKMSNKARHRRLREHLMNVSDRVRKHRADSRNLFSANHLNAFFRHAAEHLTSDSEEPFDFITAARRSNPVPSDLRLHLSNFLKFIKSPQLLMHFAVPMIASSFFLDCYPPDAPMFDPSNLLEKLYKDTCFQVSRTAILAHYGSTDMMLPSGFVKMIEAHMQQYFQDALKSGAVNFAAKIHKSVVQSFKGLWVRIRDKDTCLVCLRRRPHIGLQCGHILCENCIVVFGNQSSEDTCSFTVENCFLCESDNSKVNIRVHPPTTGASVLSIDGGGVRGVLPLAFLQLLEDRIGLPLPVIRNFKVVFGTSSGRLFTPYLVSYAYRNLGGIIALGLSEGWPIQKCSRVFTELAKVAFQRRKFLRSPIFPSILNSLVSILADCLYPASNIESALKTAFGRDTGILDVSYATCTGTRVGIPVATIREPSLCLFTNYNGVGHRDHDSEYHIINPSDESGRVLVWEIARSASAAPWFFKPKNIQGVGTYQDAGQLRNNPIFTALSEVEVLFPFIEEPDFVVSLGTGGPRSNPDGPSKSGSRGLLKDGCLPRCFRAFWETMRGKRDWQALTSYGRPKSSGKFHRLDIDFDGPEPMLDGVSGIPSLQSKVLADSSTSAVLDNIARCAISALFYFELDSNPKHVGEEYVGSGSILCILRHGDPAFGVLMNQLHGKSAGLLIGKRHITEVNKSSNFDKNGNFCRSVSFAGQERFSIYLQEGSSKACNISGSPFSIKRLVKAQNLDAYFGRADHRKRNGSSDFELPPAKRRQHFVQC